MINTTEPAITVLDELMISFYTPVEINAIIEEVAINFFILVAVLLSIYPFLYILRRLIRYAEKAFDTGAIREMENGGIWRRLPDGSLWSGLEKIARVPIFEKLTRRK